MTDYQGSLFALLPDEIIATVLHEVTLRPASKREWTSTRLVCRSWASILECDLFESVRLSYSTGSASGARVSSLLNFLTAKPYLGKYVTDLQLTIKKNDEWIYSRIDQVLDHCVKLNRVDLDVKLVDPDLPPLYLTAVHQKFLILLRKVASKEIQDLTLHGVSFDSTIAVFSGIVLQSLSLIQCSWSGSAMNPAAGTGTLAQTSRNVSVTRKANSVNTFDTGLLKRLCLTHIPPNALEVLEFMKWPKALEEIVVERANCDGSAVFTMLNVHRSSLQIIRIYDIVLHLDLSNFPNLHTIDISFYDLISNNVVLDTDTLFAPSLHLLRLRILPYDLTVDQTSMVWDKLSSAIERDEQRRKPSLREVRIVLDMTSGSPAWRSPDVWLVPARRIMLRYGVEVTYEE